MGATHGRNIPEISDPNPGFRRFENKNSLILYLDFDIGFATEYVFDIGFATKFVFDFFPGKPF